jgi:CBS domain containing-hemolysin-like protein
LENQARAATTIFHFMKHIHCRPDRPPVAALRRKGRMAQAGLAAGVLATSSHAHASIFQGDTLDSIANAISWVVIIVAPIVALAVFWLIHILPEKIAHKKLHPQTGAIQCLCLLSLCFGGLLWPIAWLWAYTKPVMYKLAYGTDVDPSLADHGKKAVAAPADAGNQDVEPLRPAVKEREPKHRSKGGKA